ncbi:hypothetical protein AB0O34_02035 [Sphaerisporangium sp. NPDC088356]|uniref:hypothetical protein n=1 Tax=Sphaerisporangium sp. NPDC088356 TaxID=3154871 RepID=UPI00341D111A
MTTTPSGLPTTPESRLLEITDRYGAESVVGRFIRRAEPQIQASVARIRAAADSAGLAL